MRVSSLSAAETRASAPATSKRLDIKRGMEDISDRYDGTRSLGNYVSAAVVGAATETVSSAVQAPRLAVEMVENLWQAETLGPNLKILGTLAALPAAVLSIPLAVFTGAGRAMSAVRGEHRQRENELLVPDTSNAVAAKFTVRNEETGPRTMTGKIVGSLEELGSRKLEEGEKPHDIPLLSPAFAVVGGVLSGAIAGSVGLVSGLVAGAITGAKDIASAFTSKGGGFGARIGKIAAAPLNLVAGPVLAWKSLKQSVPKGLQTGWDHGPLRPVVDSTKFAAHLGSGVIHEAWEK